MARTLTSATPIQTPPAPSIPEGPIARLLLTIWTEERGRWRARAQFIDGSTHVFDSPFELARFIAQPQTQARPPLLPEASNGLR